MDKNVAWNRQKLMPEVAFAYGMLVPERTFRTNAYQSTKSQRKVPASARTLVNFRVSESPIHSPVTATTGVITRTLGNSKNPDNQ